MTLREFLTDLSDYYGEKYPKTVVREIAKRLKNFGPDQLTALFAVIIESHARQYRQAPDVYAILKALEHTPPPRRPLLEATTEGMVKPEEVQAMVRDLVREKEVR